MIEKRFNELYSRAYEKGYPCYTDFLNIDEQSILENTFLPCIKYGGYPAAERIIAAFGESIAYDDFPICILNIKPSSKKFADKLTHRDFLGGLMNLGIKRELIGDIIIHNNEGYVFCIEQIKNYIADNLTRIKHTTVNVSQLKELPDGIIKEPESIEAITASLRLDAVISAVFKLSRSESAKLFRQEKVFVNSRASANGSYKIKDNDIISVRGFGRLQFLQQLRTTKKDRIVIEIIKY